MDVSSTAMDVTPTMVRASIDAKSLAIVSITMVLYDWGLTLNQEMKYFWRGSWNISRVLYLANRLLPPCSIVLGLGAFFTREPTTAFCDRAVRGCFTLNIISMGIIQAILVLRVWYLWSRSRLIQIIAVSAFVACTMATIATLVNFLASFHSITYPLPSTYYNISGCAAPPPTVQYWPVFLPALILHSILYLLTAYRALRSMRSLRDTPLLKRLLRDGGLFYLVVFFSVGYAEIGSFMTDSPQVNIPAVYSSFTLAINSVCISRVMLSIRSLAANLSLDPVWLLNNAELSRVHWKKGCTDGEIVVEVDPVEGVDLELNRIGASSPGYSRQKDTDDISETDPFKSRMAPIVSRKR